MSDATTYQTPISIVSPSGITYTQNYIYTIDSTTLVPILGVSTTSVTTQNPVISAPTPAPYGTPPIQGGQAPMAFTAGPQGDLTTDTAN
jgi:hypothetical protein